MACIIKSVQVQFTALIEKRFENKILDFTMSNVECRMEC